MRILAILLTSVAVWMVPVSRDGAVDCPAGMPEGTRCAAGHDAHGWWAMALPPQWNRTLIVDDHGGPGMMPPVPRTQPAGWGVPLAIPLFVQRGYAIAVPSYRDGLFNLDAYAEDNEALRALFVTQFGAPSRTFIHGSSFGAEVANRTAERFPQHYDGILLEDGSQAGVFQGFTWIDFRTVYQYYCGNWPRPSEPAYPLWQGVGPETPTDFFDRPRQAQMPTVERLWDRARECTGFDRPAAERSAAQQHVLRNILSVTHETEADMQTLVSASALQLRLFATYMTSGRNAFGNRLARYRGSDDDEALNRGVARYDGDPEAETLIAHYMPSGRVSIPVLTLHSIDDPRVHVEYEWLYHRRFEHAGNLAHLLQMFARAAVHRVGDDERVGGLHALERWAVTGERPEPDAVVEACRAMRPAAVCTFDTSYQPNSIFTVIPPEGRASYVDAPSRR